MSRFKNGKVKNERTDAMSEIIDFLPSLSIEQLNALIALSGIALAGFAIFVVHRVSQRK